MRSNTTQGCTEHGRMLTASGLATTLCRRGLEIKAAAAAVATTEDKDFAKEYFRSLVTKEKTLLAERRDRQQQLAGGQGLRLAPTPTPSLVG
jgi:hypothetical protein